MKDLLIGIEHLFTKDSILSTSLQKIERGSHPLPQWAVLFSGLQKGPHSV